MRIFNFFVLFIYPYYIDSRRALEVLYKNNKKTFRPSLFFGSRGRIRTDDQLVTQTLSLLTGVDYLITMAIALGAGRSRV